MGPIFLWTLKPMEKWRFFEVSLGIWVVNTFKNEGFRFTWLGGICQNAMFGFVMTLEPRKTLGWNSPLTFFLYQLVVSFFLIFTSTWGNDPIWLIFFRWVGSTTNQFSLVLNDFPKRVLLLVGLGRWGSDSIQDSCKVTWLQSGFLSHFLWIFSSLTNWELISELGAPRNCTWNFLAFCKKHRWVNSGFQLPNSCFLLLWLWCKQHSHI